MKNIALITTLCCLMSFPLLASQKDLAQQFEASALQQLQINNGVGDIRIEVTNSSQIQVNVKVRSSKNWFFGSSDVSGANIESSIKNGVLSLEVPLDDTNQTWTVQIPRQLAVSLQLGVGDIELNGTTGDIEADIGVGSFTANLAIPEYKNIELTAGVGDVSLQTHQGKTERSHVVGADLEYIGSGLHEMAVTIGVGDAKVHNILL